MEEPTHTTHFPSTLAVSMHEDAAGKSEFWLFLWSPVLSEALWGTKAEFKLWTQDCGGCEFNQSSM